MPMTRLLSDLRCPSLPEIVLAVGALALLMLGAFARRARRRRSSPCWRVGAPGRSPVCVLICRAGRGRRTFDGAFVVDRLRALHEGADADRLGGRRSCCRSTSRKRGEVRAFEYPVLVLLATLGMMMMISANDLIALYLGLELQSLALYVVAAFNRDIGALDRGRAEIFRPRRAVLGHAALRRVADLRLHRHTRLRRRSPRRWPAASASSAWSSASCSCSPASPSRSRRCRSTCGRPTSTRARRRRSPPSSPRRPRSRRWRCSSASSSAPFAPIDARLAADHRLHRHRLDGARRLRRHRPAQHQAADGLFLDRPHGLRAGRPRRRHARPACSGVLIYMAIYLVMTLGTFACILAMRRERRHGRGDRRSRRPVADQAGRWPSCWRC